MTDSRGRKLNGRVVRTNGTTIVVEVKRTFKHPVYGKTVSKTKKYQVNDPKQSASEGEVVSIVECRPISKHKYFEVVTNTQEAK